MRFQLLYFAYRLISILIHFFFTACFMFMFLEALHVWALMGNIVKKNGMFSKVRFG